MRNRLVMAGLIVAALAACGDGGTNPEDGPLKVGIVSGNNQQSPAPTPQLAQPIVGRLVRLPNGTLAWQERVIDALLPEKAYAQSSLQGSPVPGAVVCAAPVTGALALTPVVPCTNTATDGTATFAFTHGTTAGEAKAVVQGMVGGTVATFDTARAIVLPGPIAGFGGFLRDTSVAAGSSIDFNTFPVRARDYYGNLITGYSFSYRRLNESPALNDAARVTSRLVPMRAGDTLVRIWADTVEGTSVRVTVVP